MPKPETQEEIGLWLIDCLCDIGTQLEMLHAAVQNLAEGIKRKISQETSQDIHRKANNLKPDSKDT